MASEHLKGRAFYTHQGPFAKGNRTTNQALEGVAGQPAPGMLSRPRGPFSGPVASFRWCGGCWSIIIRLRQCTHRVTVPGLTLWLYG